MTVSFIAASANRIPLADESVQCVVTSPPYYGLRKYKGEQELSWDDWRGAYGLEPTIEMYVAHTVEILREIRRVLRKDGVVFWNIGDSYSSMRDSKMTPDSLRSDGDGTRTQFSGNRNPESLRASGLKHKDLCLIPERVALAAQAGVVERLVKDEWRGWLAGIIDGEGTIGIHRTVRSDGWIQYAPYIVIGMSDAEAIDHVALISGVGRRYLRDIAGTRDGRGIKSNRDYHGWRVEGEKAIWILRDIFPFLVVKRRQAKIANALYELVLNKKHANGNGPIPTEDVKRREELWAMCKACNQRKWGGGIALPELQEHRVDQWWVRSRITWAKPNPMPESVTDRPTEADERIWMLTKSARYFWDADAVATPAAESSKARLAQPNLPNQAGSNRVPGKTNGPMKAVFGGRNKHAGYGVRTASGREDDGGYIERGVNIRNVWTFPTQPYKGAHFATFPEELPRRCIKAASKPGDLILDPFGGSGTTGKVANELGRNAVLLDLSYRPHFNKNGERDDYLVLARQRVSSPPRSVKSKPAPKGMRSLFCPENEQREKQLPSVETSGILVV